MLQLLATPARKQIDVDFEARSHRRDTGQLPAGNQCLAPDTGGRQHGLLKQNKHSSQKALALTDQ